MEYQVPQFIEVEDKVVGPLTFRQFVYLTGAGGICVVLIAYLPLVVAILLCIPVAALGATLSFYKVNGKSFIEILEAGFNYYTGAKMFLWKRDVPKVERPGAAAAAAAAVPPKHAPRLTRGKLTELAWSLDVQSPASSLESPSSSLQPPVSGI